MRRINLLAYVLMSTFCVCADTVYVDAWTDSLTGITWEFVVSNNEGRVVGVRLPEGLTEIDDYFCSCSSITNVTIPSTVTRIGNCAFDGCKDLRVVTLDCSSSVEIWNPSTGQKGTAFVGVAEDCVVCVKAGSYGWDDDGDGKWQGMTLRYTQERSASGMRQGEV